MIPRRCKFLGANSLCLAWNWRANKAFRNALNRPYQTQESRLFQILRNNASSEYGKMHGFVSIESVRQYQETVPLITYDQLEPWIEEIKGGKSGILTAEPVLVLEKSRYVRLLTVYTDGDLWSTYLSDRNLANYLRSIPRSLCSISI